MQCTGKPRPRRSSATVAVPRGDDFDEQDHARPGPIPLTRPTLSALPSAASGSRSPGSNLPLQELAQLQGDYLKQATEVWNQSLQRLQAEPERAAPPIGDRRFAQQRVGSPTRRAAFTAQMYLLNARTLMQMADSVRGRRQDQGAHPLRRAAVDRRRQPEQLPGAQPRGADEGARAPRAKASPRACSTCWNDLQQGPCLADRRERVRGRPQRRHHRRQRGVRERAVPAASNTSR